DCRSSRRPTVSSSATTRKSGFAGKGDDVSTQTPYAPAAKAPLIEGVKIKALKVLPDERGYLMEILRADDPLFSKFGQVYVSATYPGVVKAWHYHRVQVDNFAC